MNFKLRKADESVPEVRNQPAHSVLKPDPAGKVPSLAPKQAHEPVINQQDSLVGVGAGAASARAKSEKRKKLASEKVHKTAETLSRATILIEQTAAQTNTVLEVVGAQAEEPRVKVGRSLSAPS